MKRLLLRALQGIAHSPLRRTLGFAGNILMRAGLLRYALVIADALVEAGRLDDALRLSESILQRTQSILPTLSPVRIPFQGQPPTLPSHTALLKALDDTLEALDREGIRPFLAFGTLLGMIREGNFIEGDGDLDLGILTTDASGQEIRTRLVAKGFAVRSYHGPTWPTRVKVQHQNGVYVDVVFFHPEGENLLTYGSYLSERIVRRRTPFLLERSLFLGRDVWVPSPPERFLDENYGSWRERSSVHHYILTSPLTDYRLPIVQYIAKKTLAHWRLSGFHEKARALEIHIAGRNSG